MKMLSKYISPFTTLSSRAKFLVLLVATITTTSKASVYQSSSGDSINVVKDGKKQGRWVITNAVLKRECYEEDQVVQEGNYVDSKKDGFWIEYYCNKKLKSKIKFEDNRPNGYAIIYHENGKVKEEGTWENNRWVGEYKLYYPNGQVQQSFNYNSTGKREGKQTYYYENGQVMIEGNWQGGKESGDLREYYENGDIKSVKTFNGGVIDPASIKTYEPKKPIVEKQRPIEDIDIPTVTVDKEETDNYGKKGTFNGEGYWQLYNSNRQLTKDGFFKKNKLIDGKVFYYDENGILTRIAIFKDGKYIGDGVIEE